MFILANYWKQLMIGLLILSLSVYIAVLKHQRNVARFELQDFKLQVEKKRVAQQIENARIAQEVAKQKEQLVIEHNHQLNNIRDYYEKISTKNSTTISTLNNRLREQGISYRKRLSDVLETANISSEVWTNSNSDNFRAYTETLEQACALTTLDYNTLYDAWIAECNLRGCQ